MEKQPAKTPIKNLRDAYKVPGFHVRAKLDSLELDEYGVAVLTLDRRAKKRVQRMRKNVLPRLRYALAACARFGVW